MVVDESRLEIRGIKILEEGRLQGYVHTGRVDERKGARELSLMKSDS